VISQQAIDNNNKMILVAADLEKTVLSVARGGSQSGCLMIGLWVHLHASNVFVGEVDNQPQFMFLSSFVNISAGLSHHSSTACVHF